MLRNKLWMKPENSLPMYKDGKETFLNISGNERLIPRNVVYLGIKHPMNQTPP